MKEGKPSETAMRVATGIVASRLDALLRPLFKDPEEPYLEWFINEHGEGARRYLAAWKSNNQAPVMQFFREQMAKGSTLFTLLRKLFIEEESRQALALGARQMVVLGAGYDPLTLRLQKEFREVRFYEVDYPATQDVKRRALVERDALPGNLSLIPVDFNQETAEEKLLQAPGFDPEARGCFVCEGTLMYLTPEDAEAVFASVRRLGGPGTRFLFTWLNRTILESDPKAQNIAKVLSYAGEPLRSSYEPEAIGDFLKEQGFKLLLLGDHEALKKRFLDPHGITRPVGALEFAVLAERKK
jgi:methyltransferase (TIGR00027 family)